MNTGLNRKKGNANKIGRKISTTYVEEQKGRDRENNNNIEGISERDTENECIGMKYTHTHIRIYIHVYS